ncbi:unnamed protein product, partial [Mesorhabditis spiculigera]
MANLWFLVLVAVFCALAVDAGFIKKSDIEQPRPKLCIRRLERNLRVQRFVAQPGECDALIEEYGLENVGYDKEIDPADALQQCCLEKCPYNALRAIGCLL